MDTTHIRIIFVIIFVACAHVFVAANRRPALFLMQMNKTFSVYASNVTLIVMEMLFLDDTKEYVSVKLLPNNISHIR